MELREYRPEDCREMAELFFDTVHTVNRRDYTEAEVEAWAPGLPDMEQWNKSFLEHCTLVALECGKIVGFGDMDRNGYLDRLYVHRDYQGKGIAAAICGQLEGRFPAKRITTYASVTAKPFFEKRGYRVVREQQVERQGVLLTNFVMEKWLGAGMDRAKNIAYCGLACCLCGENAECAGCRNAGCKDREWCVPYRCCREMGLEGCWDCDDFPCGAPMLAKTRVRAFGRFAAQYGIPALLDALEVNAAGGIVYHYENQLVGDYDKPETEAEVLKMLLAGYGAKAETAEI